MWWKMVIRVWAEDAESWPPEPEDNVLVFIPASINLSMQDVTWGWPMWPPTSLVLSGNTIDFILDEPSTLFVQPASLVITGTPIPLVVHEVYMYPPSSLFITGAPITFTFSDAPEQLNMLIESAPLQLAGTDYTLWKSLPFFAEVGTDDLAAGTSANIALSRFNGNSPNTILMFSSWMSVVTDEVIGTSCRFSFGVSDSDMTQSQIATAQDDLLGSTNSNQILRDDSLLGKLNLDGDTSYGNVSITAHSADQFSIAGTSDFETDGEDVLTWVAMGGVIESKLITINIGEGDVGGGECRIVHGLSKPPTALIFLTTWRHADGTINTIEANNTFSLGMWAENGGKWSQTVASRDAAATTDEHSYSTASYPLYGDPEETAGTPRTAVAVEQVDSSLIVLRWDPLRTAILDNVVKVLAITNVRAFVGDDTFPTSGALTLADDCGFTPQLALFMTQGIANIDAVENHTKFFIGADDGTDAGAEGYTFEHGSAWSHVIRYLDQNRSLCAWKADGPLDSSSRIFLSEINSFANQSTFTITTYPAATTPFGYMMLAPARLADVATRESAYGDEYGTEYGYL